MELSKAVRIRDYLYDEIERLAKVEHRTLIAQLEVLLEQALRLESSGEAVDGEVKGSPTPTPRPERVSPDSVSGGEPLSAHSADTPPEDPHFKPDFK